MKNLLKYVLRFIIIIKMTNPIITLSGHRPKYCPCLYEKNHPWLNKLKTDIIDKIQVVKPCVIISGGALGFDTWGAQAARYARTELNMDIELHMYIPCKNFCAKWNQEDQEIYHSLLDEAMVVKYISREYTKSCCHQRDQAMVNACDEVWALFNEGPVKKGGTFTTVKMAKKAGRPIYNFWRD